MVSSFTPNKRIEQPAHNDYVDSWDIPVNADWAIIDLALGSGVNINLTGLSGNQTLTAAQYQPLKLILAGAPTAATNIVIPSGVGGLWVVRNNTTGGFAITITSAAGGTFVTIPVNTNTLVNCDGSATGMFLAINTPPPAAGANTQLQYNNAGLLAGSAGMVWDGTTLAVTGLNNTGNTVLGDNPGGDTLTINGTGVSAPNGLNFNSNQLVLAAPASKQVGIGTATLGSDLLTVAGTIHSTAGGYVFPDGTVQTTAITATGIVADFIGGTAPPGWVWANGTTIGNAASNASGLASDTATLALFTLLWTSWANAQAQLFTSAGVTSARGVSAAADFAANRAITVPDLRGRMVGGMDVIGGSANAGRLSTYITSTTPGAIGGSQNASYGFHLPAIGVNVGQWFGGGGFSGTTVGAQSVNYDSTTDFPGDGGTSVSGGGGGAASAQHTHAYHVHVNTGGEALGFASFGASGGTNAYDGGTNNGANLPPLMVMNKIIKL